MRQRPASRAVLLVGAAAAVGLLGGCAAEPGAPAADGSAQGDALPRPEVDGYAPLTVWLTVPAAEAVPGSTGRAYGCDDLLVPVQTVPADAPDDADAALDFLFSDERGWHGDPSLWNAVFETRESLTPTGHRLEGDVDVFTFTGTVTAEGDCEAERIRAQLQETAAAHTSAGQVRLEVDGRPLDDVLGLAPLALGDEVDVPESGADPSESPTEPADEPWEEPAEDPWAEPTEDTWSEPTEDPWAESEESAEPSPTAWEEPAEETWEPQDEGADPADESAPAEDAGADGAGNLGIGDPDATEPSAP
ncbi:hypothetical protein ACEUE7_11345 [Micrococcus endophyticus]|uniref:hypothetical protein n=1 Tax=Micrococcus endophyticus TaxID=455343 RepID=UPI0035A98CB2